MIRIDGAQSDRSAQFCRELGTVALLMQLTRRHRRAPIGALSLWIRPPILLKQIRIFFSEDKGLSSYIVEL
jgi:hemolysin-activating ACP:hemolysin acyltransferase